MRVGEPAPTFTKADHNGNPVSLEGLRGQWVVVYFYPADDTPGCTAEACSFRDAFEDFTDAGAVVIGVSADSDESHTKFAAKHRLPFTLVSDADGRLRKAYGVKKTLRILPGRVTFVIDPEGNIAREFSSGIRMSQHQTEALAAIRGAHERT